MITIVLADDHTVVRQGLRALLEAQTDFSVIAEARDGLEAVKLVEEKHPEVLILDLMMPGQSGFDVMKQLPGLSPETRIVVLSMHANEAYVLESLRCGASGYVLKDASSPDLVHAVREASAGRRYLSPPLSERAIEAYVKRAQGGRGGTSDSDPLTPREKEVLQLCADGFTAAEIAERLGISPRTAETHRANMMRKLGLHSQAELIRYAFQRGLVPISADIPRPDPS